MHSLLEQFGKLDPKQNLKDRVRECHEINNYIVLNALKHIVDNDCELQHRNSLQDSWKPSTLKELIKSLTVSHFSKTEVDQFDSSNLRYWRIKPEMTYEELEQAYNDLKKQVYGK